MKQYTNACRYCLTTLLADRSNPRARLLLARAFYGLAKYKSCLESLQQLQPLGQFDFDALELQTRALARLSETYYASWGIEEVAQNTSKTRQEWLDHASSHETVIVKDSGAAGRGLFATKSVNKGDVVLCETAFAMVLPPSQLARVMCRHDLVRKRFRINPDVLLYVRVMEELQRRPTAVPDLLQLWSGEYRSEVKEVLIVDGNLVLDA